MPQDLFQISLEHHRCGRLRQAEAGYRALLGIDPRNADACHWLGVLIFQAGRADEAAPLLERAVEGRPDDAAFWHNLGQAYLGCRRLDDAIGAFDRSVEISPAQSEALFSAATARLGRHAPGDAEAAIDLLSRARAAGLDTAQLHQSLGLAFLLAGRPGDAIPEFHAALDRKPDSADLYHYLGAAHLHKQDLEGARWCLEHAMELDPKNVRTYFALAAMELDAGNAQQAEALFRKVIALEPESPAAYECLATTLRKLGRKKESRLALAEAQKASKGLMRPTVSPPQSARTIADLERRITRSPEAQKLQFMLAAQAKMPPPARHPSSAVAGLFDRYADKFDEHLVGKLDYHVPEMIAQAVAATHPTGLLDVLDLGCGTGLCGVLLKPMASQLVGVDLSPRMVAKARERGIYDRVIEGDLVETMRQNAESFDLLVCADVLNYLGDLSPTFGAASGALRKNGLFVFSVEAGEGGRYTMDPKHHRYSHSPQYLRRLAGMYGFTEEACGPITIRKEAEQPVNGLLVVLRFQS